MLRGSLTFSSKIHGPFLSQVVPPFTTMVQVGMTKDQGLYKKPSAAVHPGALAAGILPQHNLLTECEEYLSVHDAVSRDM